MNEHHTCVWSSYCSECEVSRLSAEIKTNDRRYRMAQDRANDDIERLSAENSRLEDELAKHQESEFHPDWSMLEATRDSLREHQSIIHVLRKAMIRMRERAGKGSSIDNIGKFAMKERVSTEQTCTQNGNKDTRQDFNEPCPYCEKGRV